MAELPAPLAIGYFAAEGSVSFLILDEALCFMPRQTVLKMQKVFQHGKTSLFQVTFTDLFYIQFLSYLNPFPKAGQSLCLNYLKV